MPNITRLRSFIRGFTELVATTTDEPTLLDGGSELLARLIAHDDWLPEAFARPAREHYRQYLLHCDPLERFSVVSFVWGPGQRTPIHDHTVWGLIGVLRGTERCEEFTGEVTPSGEHVLGTGGIDRVSPTLGDVHRVSNALPDAVSLSIHVYGANIGALRRHVFDPSSRRASEFVSGYSNAVLPNPWDRSSTAA